MNRRHFLSSTVLAGAGLAAMSTSAQAFMVEKCVANGSTACQQIARHKEVIAQLNEMLEQKGLSQAARKEIMATAVCPFCGQPLLG